MIARYKAISGSVSCWSQLIEENKVDKLADQLKDLEEQNSRAEAVIIMDAYLKSGKSLDEIMAFLKPWRCLV